MNSTAPPTNDPLLGALKEAIVGNRCVAIIGAGVSAPDYPLWDKLITILHSRCGVRPEDVANKDSLDVAEAAKRKSPECYSRVLDELFQPIASPQSVCRYHSLARIPFASYINLNFDSLLLETLDLHRNVFVSDYPLLQPRHLDDRELFYVHGRLGQDRPAGSTSIVLTRTEFDEAYNPEKGRLHSLLQSTFLDYDVCFIGCNPTEPHLRRLLRACEDTCRCEHGWQDSKRPRRFLLWGDQSDPPPQLRKCGIHVVYFGRADSAFSGLDRLLEHLAGRKKPFLRQPGVDRSPYDADVEPER